MLDSRTSTRKSEKNKKKKKTRVLTLDIQLLAIKRLPPIGTRMKYAKRFKVGLSLR